MQTLDLQGVVATGVEDAWEAAKLNIEGLEHLVVNRYNMVKEQ